MPMLRPIPSFAICVVLLGISSLSYSAPPFTLQGPGVTAGDFRVTVFATGLNYPKGMQSLPDDSMLVATSDPQAGAQGFYNSTGTLVRLVDSDQDGVADGPAQALFSGLPGSLSGLRVRWPLVFVVSTGSRISILRVGSGPGDPLTLVGKIQFVLPDSWLHPPSDLEVRPVDGAPGSYELYFQLGSQPNNAASTNTASITSDIGLSAVLQGDSIYRVTLMDDGSSITGSGLLRIATGLRNPAGMAFQPQTGDFYFQDNGIDGLVDANEPLSADELNVIASLDVGGTVEDFGFPTSYIEYRTGDFIGGQGLQSLFAFLPLPNPANGAESEGPAEIAFSPPLFPESLRNGVFIGFHGKFNQGGSSNEENALVFADLLSGEYFHFVESRTSGVGHLDGLLATEDSLFVADISTTGSLSSGAEKGAIYRIQSLVPAVKLVRGDSNGDGRVDVSDAIWALQYLFLGGAAPTCLDAADANDDGDLDVSDPVAILLSLFAGGIALPPPGPAPGIDPTSDELGCVGG